MYSTVIVLLLCFFINTIAYPLDIIETEAGEALALTPLTRVRRVGVYGKADITDPGKVIAGISGTPIDNDEHRLDTNVFATTNIRHHSPITKGVEASYLHKPTNSNLDVSAANTPQMGTDLKASGKYNFFEDKNTNANVEGYYEKHMGERQGSQRPDYGIKLNFKKDF